MVNYNKKLLMISGDTALAQGKRGAFYNTLKEFHKYWDRIDIITPRTNQKITYLFDNVFIHSSTKNKLLHPFFIKNKGIELFKKYSHDLMTVHEYPPFYNGIGARLLWSKTKIPYILELMHIPGYPQAANLKERIYMYLIQFFIKLDSQKANAIRVINQRETPEFLHRAGVDRKKIKYIPAFYIDLEIFKPINVEKKYDLVFAARLEKNKGILNLIKSLEIIKQYKPHFSLLIIGSGTLKETVKNYIKNNGLEDNIYLSGWLETSKDVARAYNSARFFISPSFNEGGPRVVLEAMACNLPILTTEVGLMKDIIKDGENGVFIPTNPKDMANKILDVYGDIDLYNRISDNTELVKEFEMRQSVKNYAEKIKEIL